jgi:Holliday junction resolvasome RuvABC endonuclease subunit
MPLHFRWQRCILLQRRLMKLIALDLSTTVMGYSIFDMETEELLRMDYLSFSKDDLVDRGQELHEQLQSFISEFKDVTFAIEERLKSFRSGGTNADAMLKTAQIKV